MSDADKAKKEYEDALRKVVEATPDAERAAHFKAVDDEVKKYVHAVDVGKTQEIETLQVHHQEQIKALRGQMVAKQQKIEDLQGRMARMHPGNWARMLAEKLVDASNLQSPSYATSRKSLFAFVLITSICTLMVVAFATYVRAQSFLGSREKLEQVRANAAKLGEALNKTQTEVVDVNDKLRHVEPNALRKLESVLTNLSMREMLPNKALAETQLEVSRLRNNLKGEESEALEKLGNRLKEERTQIEALRPLVENAETLVRAREHEQGWTVALALVLAFFCVVTSVFVIVRLLDGSRHERVVRDRAIRASVWVRLASSTDPKDQKDAREIFHTLFDR